MTGAPGVVLTGGGGGLHCAPVSGWAIGEWGGGGGPVESPEGSVYGSFSLPFLSPSPLASTSLLP